MLWGKKKTGDPGAALEIFATTSMQDNKAATSHVEAESDRLPATSGGLTLETDALDDSSDAYGMPFFAVRSTKEHVVAPSPDNEVIFPQFLC
jgi:hypothetical protein